MASSWAITVGEGGAPAVVMRIRWASSCACGASAIVEQTAGAPHRFVMPRVSIASQIASARTARRQTWVAPAAVTAHGVHQPLQWNIGSVHRYLVWPVNPLWKVSPRELR